MRDERPQEGRDVYRSEDTDNAGNVGGIADRDRFKQSMRYVAAKKGSMQHSWAV